MTFEKATSKDFDTAYTFIQQLWSYNSYDPIKTREVYEKIIHDKNSFFFFLKDNGEYKGFCHGDYFQTFWMCGLTCYISSLFTCDQDRHKGYGRAMLDHAKELALEKNCRAVILDSGMARIDAHRFYENYGFEKSCYGFELLL